MDVNQAYEVLRDRLTVIAQATGPKAKASLTIASVSVAGGPFDGFGYIDPRNRTGENALYAWGTQAQDADQLLTEMHKVGTAYVAQRRVMLAEDIGV